MINNQQISDPYIGTIIEGLRVEQYLGSGRYGNVYKAVADNGTVAAIKIIEIPTKDNIRDYQAVCENDPEIMENFFDQVADKFIAETESLKMLNETNVQGKNNIIKYYFHTASKKGMYHKIIIGMEFCENFTDYLEKVSLTYAHIAKIGIDIANGLEACHTKNIIHRDIKDDNIFVDYERNFKIGDFGAATISEDDARSQGIGTPYYMAPEVRSGTDYGYNADIYSLGIMLYRLLNNKRFPFAPVDEIVTVESNEQAYQRRVSGEALPRPVNDFPALTDIILKCCEYDPKQRYQSVAELRNDLLNLQQMNYSDSVWNSPIAFPKVNTQKGQIKWNPISPIIEEQQNNNILQNDSQVIEQNKVEQDMDGMKTTDIYNMLLKSDSDAAIKLQKKVEELRLAVIEEVKAKKRAKIFRIVSACGIIAVITLFVCIKIFIWPNTFSYGKNENDRGYLYLYQFGKAKEMVSADGVTGHPASYITWDEDYIYFSMNNKPEDNPENLKLHRVSRDDYELELICDDKAKFNILYNDWIYYLNVNDNSRLYRINTKNIDKKEMIIEDVMKEIRMQKDNGILFCITEDGTELYIDVRKDELYISDVDPLT